MWAGEDIIGYFVSCINATIINLMAFVFRGEKPNQTAKSNQVVGPGSYNFDVQR